MRKDASIPFYACEPLHSLGPTNVALSLFAMLSLVALRYLSHATTALPSPTLPLRYPKCLLSYAVTWPHGPHFTF